MSECDHETSIRRRTSSIRGRCAMRNHRLSHPNIFLDILKSLKSVVASCMAEHTGINRLCNVRIAEEF